MFGWLKARWTGLLGSSRNISLIASWLANAIWTIEGKFLALAQQAFGQNEIVYACLRLLSQSVPEPPLNAYRRNEKGIKTPLPYNHDLAKLIRDPNELMTEYEFWELTTLHMAIVGKSYWWKQRNRMAGIKALWPLRPDRVGPHYSDSDEDGKRVIDGWIYQTPGGGDLCFIPRADMLAFNFPDVTGESGGIVEGFGPLQVLARQVGSDNEATKFVGALLANYAAPTVALKMKAPIRNEAQAELVKAKFRHEFGGANRGTPALLDAETEITIIGFNMQQLEFPELRNTSEARIAAALGVPAILAGLKVGLVAGNNRASVTEQRAYFAETTLSNYWRRYQDQYTSDIGREYGEDIVCEFDTLRVHAMAVHFQQKVAPIREAFKNSAATRDEYRSALNLQLLGPPLGDMFLMLPGVQQIKPDGQVVISQQPGQGPQEQGKPPQGTPEAVPTPDMANPVTKALLAAAIKDASLDEEETALAAALAALMSDYEHKAVATLVSGQPFDLTEFETELGRALWTELVGTATEEALRQGDLLAIGFDPVDATSAAYTWASQYIPAMVTGLIETTRKGLEEVQAQYFANPGMNAEQLQALFDAVFGEGRQHLIAITENSAAIIAGVVAAQAFLDKMGVKKVLVYKTAHDERVCPRCGPLDGRVQGQSGFTFPPLHGRCRCRLEVESA